MTDVQERLGVSVDESSMSFENIVAAIHVMQESMQIGGTTAREAATTIEGSVNSMKAAWSNWVTELGKDDADMAKLTDELVESFETAAKNVVPRIGVIVGTAIGQLPALIAELGPVVVDSVGQIGEQAIGALRDSVSADNPMADLVFGVTNALAEVERRFNGFKSLWSMGENPIQSFSLVAEYALSLLNGDLEALTGNSNFADAVTNALRSVGDFAASAADGMGQLAERFDAMGALDAAASVLNTLAEFIGRVADQAGEYLMPVLDSAGEALSELFSAVAQAQEWLQPLADFLADVLVAALQIVVAALIAAVDVVTLLVNAVNELASFIMGVPASVQSFVDQVGALFGQLPGLIGGFLASAIASVGAWALQTAAQAAQAGSQFLSGVDSFFGQLPGSVAGFLAQAVSRVGSWAGEMASGAARAASDFGSSLVSGLQSLPGRVYDIGAQIINGIVSGITGAAGSVVSAITGAVGSAIDSAKSLLGIHSPSRVFRDMFGYVMEGAALGIDDNADLPVKSMESATAAVEDAARFSATVDGGSAYGGTTPEGAAAIIAWLGENLPAIIEQYTPTMGEDEFGRKARKAVAYA